MPKREIIEGNPVLLVIDIQENDFVEAAEASTIPAMPGYLERVSRTRELIDVAHDVAIPIVFVKARIQQGERRSTGAAVLRDGDDPCSRCVDRR